MLLAVVLALVSPAAASDPPTGWGGENPFNCVVQQAGFGTEVPDPEADPYCIEFDKTHQNVSELGVVDFLANEPARVAAAGDKCFYFQSDHWRGSFVQDDGSTKTYEWDGHYFFDKARAEGGAYVTNFNVNGRTQDPSSIPGMPPEYARHMGPGTGGVITRNSVDADPACVARANSEPEKIYARPPSASGPRGCVSAAGILRRRGLGAFLLGTRDGDLRAKLGDPAAVRRGISSWCAAGGGALLIGQPGDRSGDLGSDPAAQAVLVASSSPATRIAAHRRTLRPGNRLPKRARERAHPHRRPLGRSGRTRFFLRTRNSRVFIAVRAGRVVLVGTTARAGRPAKSLARRAAS
jgi:hypothetical protein